MAPKDSKGTEGAKVRKSCRSRQVISDEYSFAIIGVYTGERAPQSLVNISQPFFPFFFSLASDKRSSPKARKVGPFECDELEKHCRVSAKCYPTKVSALYTMTKETFNSAFLTLAAKNEIIATCDYYRFVKGKRLQI